MKKNAKGLLREVHLEDNFRVLNQDEVLSYAKEYMAYLDASKTEREAVKEAEVLLLQKGFEPFEFGRQYGPGSKVYWVNKKKSLIAAIIGKRPLEEGCLIGAAHIDSPRLDLKPLPLYEDTNLAYFKTHYYGGIKKYQWAAIPLSLHGVIVRKDGTSIELSIGEDESDPVFYISDLLPHLSRKAQADRKMGEVIKGEELNILLGSIPSDDKDVKEAVKYNVMKLLNEKYGIVEDDFISAELEVVPAMKARFIGFDQSMIGAYGQDDRVCAFATLKALQDLDSVDYTAIAILADKEEIGSVGNTGLNSDLLRNFLENLCSTTGSRPENVYIHSKCLSADVNAAFDPTFSEVHDRRNAAYLNQGPCLTKYTGSGGKGGSNDASAEFMHEIRTVFDRANIPWQISELGKVDEGGGGTVAQFVSRLGIDTVDIGVGLLSMHSPYELSSTLDDYALYLALKAFFKMN